MRVKLMSVCLLVLFAAAGYGQADKGKPADEPKMVSKEKTDELLRLFADYQRAQIAAEYLGQVLIDENSPCFRQVAQIVQRDLEAKAGKYSLRLAAVREENGIPKGWVFDVQKAAFTPPK